MVGTMCFTSSFYEKNAIELANQYDSIEFESVHYAWKKDWPKKGKNVLDVGAGSGRDAKWFAKHGCNVLAVEPAETMRKLGEENTPVEVTWLEDELPTLYKVRKLSCRYDLILVSAVWMHLPVMRRYKALSVLAKLLTKKGKIVITLRQGSFDDGRKSFGVSLIEIERLTKQIGLNIAYIADSGDAQGRTDVTWQTVVLDQNSKPTNKHHQA